jgi:hypothetical protein
MKHTLVRFLIGIVVAAACSIWPGLPAVAQNNAVCTGTTQCGTPLSSPAFLDAGVAGILGTDFCQSIRNILTATAYPANTGAVIDARGLSTSNTSMSCPAGKSPWFDGTHYLNEPSTILLPAGTITIPSTWVLPAGTKLIGEGSQNPLPPVPNVLPGATIIQACTSTISGCNGTNFSGPMLQFGSTCPGSQCTGIVNGVSVENVVLNGNGLSITGIQNGQGQELTYVDHVTLYQILGTGLVVSGSANNSGPYSNITFDTGAFSPNSSTSCAQILGLTGTRGLHGLTCIGESSNGFNAVLLDSSNNSLEDIRIVGFDNGIVVGSQDQAHSNVLLNIYGDTMNQGGSQVINVIEISTTNPVTDLSIMGVANAVASGENTISDSVTGTHLADATVGMYVLGQSKGGGGHTRFTTSPNAATWVVGTAQPAGACSVGSLFSNVSGAHAAALYVCKVGANSWSPVK